VKWLERWRRYRRVSGAGGAEIFCYGECLCGWAMLGTEGARWPRCPECDRQVMPPTECPPRLEAAVILLPPPEAIEEVRRIGHGHTFHGARPKARHYQTFDVARALSAYGFGADGRKVPPRRDTA
jgi:hypothetical protein